MNEFTYSQLVSTLAYYLFKYPSVAVALDCTLEDVEGNNATMAKEIRSAMDRINGGESDVDVLLDWADQTGSKDLETLGSKIKEGRRRNEDIGYFVRRYIPVIITNDQNEYEEKRSFPNNRGKKSFHKKRRY